MFLHEVRSSPRLASKKEDQNSWGVASAQGVHGGRPAGLGPHPEEREGVAHGREGQGEAP